MSPTSARTSIRVVGFAVHASQAQLTHQNSWTKPYLETVNTARSLRQQAGEEQAAALMTDNPAQRAALQQRAD